MAFELSCFAPSFYFNEAEPYDGGPEPSEQPTSVWHAVVSMPESDWAEMCAELFLGINPDHVTPELVLERIQATNTCTDLRSPVEVWIDEDGYHTIRVWDRDNGEK